MLDKRNLLILALIVALAASNAAWATLYLNTRSELAKLRDEYMLLNKQAMMLADQVKKLNENNTALILQLQHLKTKCQKLAELLRQAQTAKLTTLIEILEALNQTLTELWKFSLTHVYYTDLVKTLVQPDRVADVVMDITGSSIFTPQLAFKHLRMLYNYTAYRIETASDQPVLAVTSPKYVEIEGKKYIYSFKVEEVDNYIQSALETVVRGAGDCEDKAILLTSFYIEYLGDYGDSWVVCVFGEQGYSHCFTVAYVKPYEKFIVADPTLDFYTTTSKLSIGVEMLFEYIGLRWSDVKKAIVFNDRVFEEGTLSNILNFIVTMATR